MKSFRSFVFYFLALSFLLSGNELFSIRNTSVPEEIEINEFDEEIEETEEGQHKSSYLTKKLFVSQYSKIIKSFETAILSFAYSCTPVPLTIFDHLPHKVSNQFSQKPKLFILYSRLKLDC